MKSAYELAMERLEKSAPTVKVSAEQKAKIAEIDSLYRSKIAERETFLEEQITKARAKGEMKDVEMIQAELVREKRVLEAECEEKKEKARSAS
jgi:hypothetical protein